MILLKTLTIKDFLSHESTSINFSEGEKTLIDGKSGSGKSSLTEAILWALYGTGRSDNRSLVRRGAKSASVALKLVDGQQETLITRTTTPAGKNTLNVTQNTGTNGQFLPITRVGSKDIQSWIEEEYLKASYELFTNSVAYPQENENSFVKASAGKRKDLLLEIIKAGNFDDLYERTKQSITENDIARASDEGRLLSLEAWVEKTGDPQKDFKDNEILHTETSALIKEETKKEKELEGKLGAISTNSQQITDKKTIIKMLEKSNSDIVDQIGVDTKMIAKRDSIDIKELRISAEKVDVVTKEIEAMDSEIKEAVEFQSKINAHLANRPHVLDYSSDIATINQRLIPLLKETDRCPAGDQCPFVLPIQGQIDFLVEQIAEREDRSIKEKLSLEKWEHELSEIGTAKDLSELYREQNDLRLTLNMIAKAIEQIQGYDQLDEECKAIPARRESRGLLMKKNDEEIEKNMGVIKELELTLNNFDVNGVNRDLSECRMNLKILQGQKEKAAVNMEMATRVQLELKEAKSSIASLQKRLSQAREDKESLEILKEALSPRGIKAVIIDYLVPQLEERINGVLSQMSDFKIRLDTQMPTADEEGKKEGLFITVINDCLYPLPFEAYSGGEKIKITVAISEALASLMGQVGFRIMDENIVSLDKDSTEGFIAVLAALQEKFPQLLVVSHLQEVKDVFEKKITVTKINGVSKII